MPGPIESVAAVPSSGGASGKDTSVSESWFVSSVVPSGSASELASEAEVGSVPLAVRVPVPQGMGSPLGWVALVGEKCSPLGDAIWK